VSATKIMAGASRNVLGRKELKYSVPLVSPREICGAIRVSLVQVLTLSISFHDYYTHTHTHTSHTDYTHTHTSIHLSPTLQNFSS
jgi:hypothetical protein